MKKIIFCSLIGGLFSLVACSKNDDNNQVEEDVVFSAKYIPLENFGELGDDSSWFYQGAKIGSKNYGDISSSNCLSVNTLFLLGKDMVRRDSVIFNSYKSTNTSNKDCALDFTRTMRNVRMASKGHMFVDIYDYTLVPVDTIKTTSEIVYDTVKKTIYKGNLEIGFQKDMLRVEDKFTRYTGKEKVYLYFNKFK